MMNNFGFWMNKIGERVAELHCLYPWWFERGVFQTFGRHCISGTQKEKMKHFPPLPSRISPDNSFMRSDYMTKVKEGFGIKESKCEKLVYSLSPQPIYYIYSEMLKYLLENDMVT